MAGTQVRSPYDVNISEKYNPTAYQNTQFDPAKVSFTDTLAGYKPDMQAAQIKGHGFEARDYDFKADQVNAERIAQAKDVVAQQLGPFERVQAERIANPAADIKSFDIGQVGSQITPQQLERFQMQRPDNVTARDVTTNAFTDEGVRQKYMDPYMMDVVKQQQADAQRIFNEQLAQSGGQAAAAGAFGGSRQAVLRAPCGAILGNQQQGIAASGLQQAFQNAQQQIRTRSWREHQAEQLHQAAGSQAGGTNQQAGLATIRPTAGAALTAGAGCRSGNARPGMNQNNAMQIALANQQAQLQAQGLGVNTNLQSMMANQQYGMQAALANQGAGIDVGKANQAAALQAAMANQASYGDISKANAANALQAGMSNQQANLQAQLEGAKMGQSDRQYGAGLNNTMNMAQAELTQGANSMNTQLGFDALKTQYGGNLQSGLANQQAAQDAMKMTEQSKQFGATMGENQNQFGADLNLRTQQAQQQIMNDIIKSNLAATSTASNILGQEAGLESESFNQGLNANTQLGNMGLAQAGLDQNAQNQAYQHWMAQQSYPMQQMMAKMGILGPMANVFGTQTQNQFQQGPSMFSQIMGGIMAGAGLAMPG